MNLGTARVWQVDEQTFSERTLPEVTVSHGTHLPCGLSLTPDGRALCKKSPGLGVRPGGTVLRRALRTHRQQRRGSLDYIALDSGSAEAQQVMNEETLKLWQSAVRDQEAAEVARLLRLDASLAHELIVFTRGNGTTYRVSPIVVSRQSLEITKMLVEAGADVNTRDEDGGTTPLSGPSYEVGVYLIGQGADIDAFGYEELTPIAYATYDQNLALVEHLLAKGAKVNKAHPAEGIAPLHYAARKCETKLIRVLLDGGADPTIRDAKGETPLDWAREANRGEDVLSALIG